MKHPSIQRLTVEGQRLIKKLGLNTSRKPYTSNYDEEYTPEIYWDLSLTGKAQTLLERYGLPLFLVLEFEKDSDDIYVAIDYDSERVLEWIPLESFSQKHIDCLTKNIAAELSRH